MAKIEIDLVDLTVLQAQNVDLKKENEHLKEENAALSIRRAEIDADRLAFEGFFKYQKAMLALLGFESVEIGRYLRNEAFQPSLSFRDAVRTDQFNANDFGLDMSLEFRKGYKRAVIDVTRIAEDE
jgi:hypothetical protein